MLELKQEFLEAYLEARKELKELIGKDPSDYVVALFIDSQIYDSVLMQTLQGETPHALLSTNELELLREIKDNKKIVPNGIDLFFGSKKPRIYLPSNRFKLSKQVLKAKLVQLLAMATLCENSMSRFPTLLEQIYRNDSIIKELFSNNVFELIKERGTPWAWQYFQDFVATMRLLAIYGFDDFYVPPNTVRKTSVFYNFLLEIKDINKERAQLTRKLPLFDLVLVGFGHKVLRTYINSLPEKVQEGVVPQLKANLGQPIGELGSMFFDLLSELEENKDKNILEIATDLKSDYDLVRHWNRKETKQFVEELREKSSQEAIHWHSYRNGYWTDLWPLRARTFDQVAAYIGKIQRKNMSLLADILEDKPEVEYHGSIELSDKEVVVFSIKPDTIGQEQLIILRNHLLARKDEFLTPLPGLPDVIVFKKFAGMHIASYIGVKNTDRYPKSPYDLPLITRAIQVSKKKDAYLSVLREEEGKLSETADYSKLKGLSEPQHRAIRYLIRQEDS